MKWFALLRPFALICALTLPVGACLFKPARAPVRNFILAPIPPAEHVPAAATPFSLEIAAVKMPSYLLRDSMMVRKSATEIEYLDNAVWAQRLDECLRQTLAKNLTSLLGGDRARQRNRVEVRLSIDVEEFDLDTHGRGTLIASWLVAVRGADGLSRNGQVRLTRSSPLPGGNPEAIAAALSALTSDFSQELARAISEVTQASSSHR